MKTKQAILNILLESKTYVSGESIAKKLNISRVAVNKGVNSLRADGYNVSSVTNKGYLLTLTNCVDVNAIKLKSGYAGSVIYHNQTTSTNSDCKALADNGEYSVVIAKTQTGGKGRFDRKLHLALL